MKRHLRPEIEKALTIITVVLGIFIAMIDDMEMSFIPIYLLLAAIVGINVMILKKYGKGEL